MCKIRVYLILIIIIIKCIIIQWSILTPNWIVASKLLSLSSSSSSLSSSSILKIQNRVPFISNFGNYWSKFHSTHHQNHCTNQNNKLLSLLNLLCNTTQTTSIQERDACYGCFFRAGNLPGGATQLSSLSQCANLYLLGSAYAECARQLALVANGTVPTTAPTAHVCYTGYCDFVRCVRRINANRLIDDCFVENMANRNLTIMLQRVYFYRNVTSCILARARCNAYNPISGELQNQVTYQYGRSGGGTYEALNPIAYNSLQIASTGDIRIISFPATINVADLFCSRVSTLEQSSYGNLSC